MNSDQTVKITGLQNSLPVDWELCALEGIAEVLDSRRVPVNAKEREKRQGNVPYYGATGQVGWIDDFLFDEELVLLGEDGAPFFDSSKPKAYIIRGKAWVNNHAHVLRTKGDIPSAYLKFFLDIVDYHGFVTGTTRAKLNQKAMRRIPVPVAPLSQQTRIVAEIEKQFSRLDEAVANLKRVKANLKRYKAAVLKAAVEGKLTEEWRRTHVGAGSPRPKGPSGHDQGRGDRAPTEPIETGAELLERILEERRANWQGRGKYKEPVAPDTSGLPELPEGWVWASVEQLTRLVTSGSRGWGDSYSEVGHLFIRAQDIKTDNLVLRNVARVNVPSSAEGTRSSVSNDDILVTITGANVTKSALVKGLKERAFVSQHVALLKPCIFGVSACLYLWIVSPANGRQQLEKLAYGAGKPGLSLEQIRTLPVPIPPLDEHHRIVAEAERLLSIVAEAEAQVDDNLRRANRLRQSILSMAFSGRLEKDPSKVLKVAQEQS